MRKYAPLATLVAVVLLGAVLLVANMMSTPAAQDTAAPAADTAAPAAAVAPAPAAPAPAEAAPAPAPVVAERAYTGRTAGNEVTVTIAVKDGKGVAYVCDGKKVEAWLEGALDGEKLTMQGKGGSLTATVDDKAGLGEITVNGAEWPFSAEGVAAPAGLVQDRAAIKSLGVRGVTQR